jgi:hypothetical protein
VDRYDLIVIGSGPAGDKGAAQGTIDLFVNTVFNYPSLDDACKYAATTTSALSSAAPPPGPRVENAAELAALRGPHRGSSGRHGLAGALRMSGEP